MRREAIKIGPADYTEEMSESQTLAGSDGTTQSSPSTNRNVTGKASRNGKGTVVVVGNGEAGGSKDKVRDKMVPATTYEEVREATNTRVSRKMMIEVLSQRLRDSRKFLKRWVQLELKGRWR